MTAREPAASASSPAPTRGPELPRRIVLINNAPAPYRFTLFAELERQAAASGIDFSVLFWTPFHATRPHFAGLLEKESFRWHDANCRAIKIGDYKLVSPAGIRRKLDELQPEVIISTGAAGPSLAALRWARMRRAPFVLWWGGRAKDCTRFYHPWLHARVIRRCDGFVAYGSEARDYLVERGAPPDRVEIGLNTRDTAEFAAQVEGLRASPPRPFDGADAALWERVRASAAGHVNVLVVSRLQGFKNVALALRVVARARAHAPLRLHVVGDGPERPALEALAAELGLSDAVVFWGMVRADQTPLFYAIGDIALAPSRHETWGFAQVESLASSIPTLSSTWAACTADIIHDGVNGFALHPEAEDAWAAALQRLLDEPAARARMGEAAGRLAREELSVARSASGFLRATISAWGRRRRP